MYLTTNNHLNFQDFWKDQTISNEAIDAHSALKLEKKCNFKSTKTHYLHFQKWQKINFCTRKKSENCIFGSFKLFSGAKIDFFAIFENANNAFLHF